MPSISFKGFSTGSSVALSAAQGADTAFGSVSTWGQQNLGSINILMTAPPDITAPTGVWFEATDITGFNVAGPGQGAIYDPSFHEITYIWTVRDAPLLPYSAPQNMVAGWNNPNVAYGRKVALHFPDPGTYTVDLWAVDSDGTTATSSQVVTVVDADAIYPGTQTVCFSNDPAETWADEKPGCQRATAFYQLSSAVLNAGGPLRILFKRGQNIPKSQVERVRVNSSVEWMNHIGTWGSGAKPIINCLDNQFVFQISGNAANNPVEQLTIENIDFRGDWDAASETGIDSQSPLNFISNPQPCHYTISQCDFSGMAIVWLGVNDRNSYATVADCTRTDWRDYGLFFHTSTAASFALLGTRVMQNVDAGNGAPNGEGKNGMWNDHGPLRYGSIGHMYMACCDIFSRNGWFDRTDQPCLRLNTDGDLGASTILDRLVCEGGNVVISLKGNNSGTQEKPGSHLIDRALLIGTAMTFEAFIRSEYSGLSVRNTIGIVPNVPGFKPLTWSGGVNMVGEQLDAQNLNVPIRVYGNTFLNLQNTANDPGHSWSAFSDSEGFQNVTVENNLLVAPALDTPVSPPGTVDLSGTIPGITPRYKGVQHNEFGQQNGNVGGTIGYNASFTVPYPAGTNQAYWQAIEAIDIRHRVRFGNQTFHAESGHFTVDHEASSIRITNTSGTNWSGAWTLRLDRKSQRSAIPAFHASPASLPMPQPDSPIGQDLGIFPHDDFEGTTRTAPRTMGAIRP